MGRLLFWIPDSFMSIAIMVIALGLMVGLIRPKRAFSLIGLIALILISGPFVDALVGVIWNTLPLWIVLLAVPFVMLWLARAVFHAILGRTATDHMTGILAARGVLWASRGLLQLLTFPFRLLLRRLS
jgi:hypothetical protein